MNKKITFLGIETSCDETAAAVIRENEKGTADILSNVVSSQIEEHKEFGGVVPELAARAHLENIEFIIDKALKDSKICLKEIDGGAATAGPRSGKSVLRPLNPVQEDLETFCYNSLFFIVYWINR